MKRKVVHATSVDETSSDEDETRTTPSSQKKKKIEDDELSSSDEKESTPSKKRHSTAPAFGNALNAILDDHLILDKYRSSNKSVGIKFKALLRSLAHMEIVEKYFIFNNLHDITYQNLREEDCIALLSLGFTEINNNEIQELMKYLKSNPKPPNLTSKYKHFEFENETTRYHWQLSFQTWVTFWHDMIECFSTENTANIVPSNVNDTADEIDSQSNMYVKVINVVRKKIRHLPGKNIGRTEISSIYSHLCNTIGHLDEANIQKLEGIHLINEKSLYANFFFHFMQNESEKRAAFSEILKNVPKRKLAKKDKAMSFTIPITTKTTFGEIPFHILEINAAIVFFNKYVKPYGNSLTKTLRGPSIHSIQPVTYEIATEQPTTTTTTTVSNVSTSNESLNSTIVDQKSATTTSTEQKPTVPTTTETKMDALMIGKTSSSQTSSIQSESSQSTNQAAVSSPPQISASVASTTTSNVSDVDTTNCVSIFYRWWSAEVKLFKPGSHQSTLQLPRMLQYFNQHLQKAMGLTSPLTESEERWQLILKAIEKGNIPRLRMFDEQKKMVKILDQE
ncbi:hypothetical protein FDP41_007201 [Naegleria fowleri]|uniref:Uncharacterized protein n=1 Tax=Naegleria fowleri TaxID=5763 RepID=A0A6A5BIC1_NAEFO|nr:uncharacterized protein FDP41_007201 [Naegleria fowleri]KAF0973814.1 hypothetical protein FDP41_007201 [Naegleria fowleri]CAG4718863.1 unnamed protein product [Naegleria fowleri]